MPVSCCWKLRANIDLDLTHHEDDYGGEAYDWEYPHGNHIQEQLAQEVHGHTVEPCSILMPTEIMEISINWVYVVKQKC